MIFEVSSNGDVKLKKVRNFQFLAQKNEGRSQGILRTYARRFVFQIHITDSFRLKMLDNKMEKSGKTGNFGANGGGNYAIQLTAKIGKGEVYLNFKLEFDPK